MKTSPRSILLTSVTSITLAAVLATAASTHASIITWGLPQNITGDSDVSLDGSLVRAFNIGASGTVASTTVNGVTFDPFAIPSQAPSVTVGNFTLATAAPNGLQGNFTSSAGSPFTSLSASYQSLLGMDGQPNNGGFSMTLTMSGLTVGQSYAFQWWANNSRLEFPSNTTATAGNSITLDVNTSDALDGLGQFAIGTFIADATGTEIITFSSPSNTLPTLNGFQLRQVPEPSTWAMLAVGAGLLLAFRRRSPRQV